MKLILCYGGLKRKIDGDFSVCMSVKDLDTLVKRLSDASAAMKTRGIESGWFDIRDPLERNPSTEPSDWHDQKGIEVTTA